MNTKKTYSVDEAINRMEQYCTYQDRCHKEVEQKLYEMNMIPQAKAEILMHLIEQNYLNEERFAKAYVRGKFRIKKWGKQRLKLELKRRNIHTNLINSALKEISDVDYLETFNEIATKKAESLSVSNRQVLRKKIADYLFYRGWESHLVYDKIRELVP